MNVIYFVILLSSIITIHELGHFVTAKKFNVYVPEFSIGMGPKLWQTSRGETKYTIRALPIGGYVAMAGEEGIAAEGIPFERTLLGIAHWKRIVITVAGAFMNFVLAWVIFAAIFMYNGKVVVPPAPVIGGIMENSPAARADIQAGDIIVQVMYSDGSILIPKNYYDFINESAFYDDEVVMTLRRGEKVFEISIAPEFNEEAGRPLFGLLAPQPTILTITPWQALGYASKEIGNSASSVVGMLGKLVRGTGLDKLSGPVGIYEATKEQVSYGLISYLALMGMLSVNIGIFNLLPLPILDGGRVLLTMFEGITKIKINQKIEAAFMVLGIIMMGALFVFVTYQDIIRLIGG